MESLRDYIYCSTVRFFFVCFATSAQEGENSIFFPVSTSSISTRGRVRWSCILQWFLAARLLSSTYPCPWIRNELVTFLDNWVRSIVGKRVFTSGKRFLGSIFLNFSRVFFRILQPKWSEELFFLFSFFRSCLYFSEFSGVRFPVFVYFSEWYYFFRISGVFFQILSIFQDFLHISGFLNQN